VGTITFKIHGTEYVYLRMPDADPDDVDAFRVAFGHFDIDYEEDDEV
jgi:hypothetical protein